MSDQPIVLRAASALAALSLALTPLRGACDETRLDVHAPAGIETLADWDPVSQGIAKAADELHAFDDLLGPDVAGRTVGQYVDEWVMTPGARSQLEVLKQQAVQQEVAGDKEGLDGTFKVANRIAQVQIYRITVLGNYGVARDGMREHMERIKALVQRLPAADQAAAMPSPDGPAQLLRGALLGDLQLAEPPVEYADDSLRRYEQLGVDPLNAERVRIAWLVSDSERARGVAPKGRDRQTPCPESTGKTSGSDRPLIDRSHAIPPLPYPGMAQRKNFSGKVELEFHVAASGCVNRVDIYHSVGIDELDSAALTWAEGVNYFPAEKDGKPVDSTQVVSVTFKIAD